MSDIGAKVAELIAAGCAPEVAARVVAEAYVAGVESAAFRGHSADTQAEERRRRDRERKRLKRDIPQNSADSADIPQNSKSASLSNINNSLSLDREMHDKPRPRTSRGSRLPPEWEPTPQDREMFTALLGPELFAHELAKFRDHWPAQPGQKGVKLDWSMTFRNWMRNVRPPRNHRPLTAHQAERQTARNILDDLDAFATGCDSRQDDLGFLPRDPSQRPQGLRSGLSGDVISLPAISRQTRG